MDMETIRGCEERLVNVWPAVSTLLMEGWVVRFAHGYSGRANSASAVVPGARMSSALLDTIEKLYRDAGLKPSVRITPLANAAVEPLLMQRGYRIKDESRMMMLPTLACGSRPPPAATGWRVFHAIRNRPSGHRIIFLPSWAICACLRRLPRWRAMEPG
jgi:hypothetical protein